MNKKKIELLADALYDILSANGTILQLQEDISYLFGDSLPMYKTSEDALVWMNKINDIIYKLGDGYGKFSTEELAAWLEKDDDL